jgi:RHS repeat-associated protein
MNVGGRCIGEETDGVVSYYITDALGSVTHLVDESFAVVKTMRYKPYGEILSRSGTMRDSVMQWVGSYGYRATSFPASSHYVRARHFSTLTGSWITADPLFPDERAYGYVNGMVSQVIDPSGKGPVVDAVSSVCKAALNLLTGKDQSDLWDSINKCVSEGGSGCKPINVKSINCLAKMACGGGGSNPSVDINFNPKDCCKGGKNDGDCAWVNVGPNPGGGSSFGRCLSGNTGRPQINVCKNALTQTCNSFGTKTGLEETIMHEMLHCCGVPHGDKKEPNTCNTRMSCCIFRELGTIPKGTKCYQ